MKAEAEVKKAIGGLVAKLLAEIAGRPKDAAALDDLATGDLSKENLSALAKSYRGLSPVEMLRTAAKEKFVGEAAKEAIRLIDTHDYAGLLSLLKTGANSNPYCDETRSVAKRLVGSPIVLIQSPGRVTAGIITATAAYNGRGEEEWHLVAAEPGTLGLWHSNKRGGYDVLCIAAHQPGEKGYVGIWEVTTCVMPLGMKDVVEKFTGRKLEGKSLTDPYLELKLCPRYGTELLTQAIVVRAEEKKGTGCVASYRLCGRPTE